MSSEIAHIKLWWWEMPISTVDELENGVFLLVYKWSINELIELLKHFGSLVRWFNPNMSHRSFIFSLENDKPKSLRNNMLPYEKR